MIINIILINQLATRRWGRTQKKEERIKEKKKQCKKDLACQIDYIHERRTSSQPLTKWSESGDFRMSSLYN